MKVKEDFFSHGNFKIGDGLRTRFWEDTWLGNKPWQLNIRSSTV
jgi:hypothetical protein